MTGPLFRHPRAMAPALKFAAMLGFIAATYLVRDLRSVLLLIALQAVIAVLSGVFRAYRITLTALLFAAFTLCLFQIFTINEGQVVFYLFPFWKLGMVTDVGLRECLLLCARMMSSVGVIPLLLAMTSQTQIVSLISGTFRLPSAYTIMLVTALRFIPTFGERMRLVMQAEASRGYHADSRNPLAKVGMVMRMSLPLLVSCARDVDTLALSIETRGFDPRTKLRPQVVRPIMGDYLLLTAVACALASVVLVDRIVL